MKMIELIIIEKTDKSYFFKIIIEKKAFFGLFKKIEVFNCFKDLNNTQSRFTENGQTLFNKFLNLDSSINALLSKSNKNYNHKD